MTLIKSQNDEKAKMVSVKVCNKKVVEDMAYVPTHQPHAIMECTTATHAGNERSVAAIKDDSTHIPTHHEEVTKDVSITDCVQLICDRTTATHRGKERSTLL
jgi:hypothetical protein